MKNNLLTVFARLEHAHELPPANPDGIELKDVQIYKDKEAKIPFARYPWHQSGKPTRRNKYVTLDCYKWNLQWI